MVAQFGGKGPGYRVCNPRKAIAATIGKGRCRDLYVVAGVGIQVCAARDGGSIPGNAYLKTAHSNRINHGVVIGSPDNDIASTREYVLIELDHQGTRHVDLGAIVYR